MSYSNVAAIPATEERVTFSVFSGWRGGWKVVQRPHRRALAIYDFKRDAVRHAREAARRVGGEIFIHDEDGMIEDVRVYNRRTVSAARKR